MKKLMMVFVLALFSLSLIACGSDKDSDSNDKKGGSQVKVIDIQLTQEDYAFGVDKNKPELLEQVNDFIVKINEDGTFEKILNNYFGDGEP